MADKVATVDIDKGLKASGEGAAAMLVRGVDLKVVADFMVICLAGAEALRDQQQPAAPEGQAGGGSGSERKP